jgi:hypothetical protein
VGGLTSAGNVSACNAIRTPQFWLLCVPFLYGLYQLLIKIPALFGG